MFDPLPKSSPNSLEREAWVESQAWRQCVAKRNGDGGSQEPLSAKQVLESLEQAMASDGPEGSAAVLGDAERHRLEQLLRQVSALSLLKSERAPLDLDDRVLGALALRGEVENDEVAASSIDPEKARRSEEELGVWMSMLSTLKAPAALDALVERELETRREERKPAFERIGGGRIAAAPALEREDAVRPRPMLHLLRRHRRIVVAAAAVLFVGGLGLVLQVLQGQDPGRGGLSSASTRFSFRYIDINSPEAAEAKHPVLRLLRGWASHISSDALDRTDSRK